MMRISEEMPDLNTLHEAVQWRCPPEALIPGSGETRIRKRIDAMELDWVTSLNPRTKRQTVRGHLRYNDPGHSTIISANVWDLHMATIGRRQSDTRPRKLSLYRRVKPACTCCLAAMFSLVHSRSLRESACKSSEHLATSTCA